MPRCLKLPCSLSLRPRILCSMQPSTDMGREQPILFRSRLLNRKTCGFDMRKPAKGTVLDTRREVQGKKSQQGSAGIFSTGQCQGVSLVGPSWGGGLYKWLEP